MGNPETEPTKEYTEPTRCGHCGNTALMEMVTSFQKLQDDGYSEGGYYQEFLKWKLSFCPVCSSINVLKANWMEWADPEDPEAYKVIYPPWGKPILDLPSSIDKAYQADCEARNANSN